MADEEIAMGELRENLIEEFRTGMSLLFKMQERNMEASGVGEEEGIS